MGLRTDLHGMETRKILPLPRLELHTLGNLVIRQSLYRLRYPGFSTYEAINYESCLF
jgi:hypothetical protein